MFAAARTGRSRSGRDSRRSSLSTSERRPKRADHALAIKKVSCLVPGTLISFSERESAAKGGYSPVPSKEKSEHRALFYRARCIDRALNSLVLWLASILYERSESTKSRVLDGKAIGEIVNVPTLFIASFMIK